MSEESKKEPEIRVRSTPEFKLKDRPPKRRAQPINLKNQFGFIPEVIIIEKVWGKNNRMIVRAVLTPEELEKEDKRRKEFEKNRKEEIKKRKKELGLKDKKGVNE